MQRFLDFLCERSQLATSDALNAKSLASKTRAPLDRVLTGLGLISEDELANCYEAFFEMPRCHVPFVSIDEIAISKTNRNFLLRYRTIPVKQKGNADVIAIVDPFDEDALNGTRFALGVESAGVIITATEFEQLYANAFNDTQPHEFTNESSAAANDAATLKDLASTEPAVRLVNRLIGDAARLRASDIHIEPKERDVHVRQRIDGVLATSETLTRAQGLSAVSRLKILANLDIAERRRPQDGRLSFPVGGRSIDMRVSTTPTIHGESVVIRLLEKPVAALGLDSLGFSPSQGAALTQMISQPNGILLITGPTGSGKTTTLYALLELLAKRELKILTIEDPVEFRIDDVSQTQVNPAIGLNFASAMRSFLRHDPDVIMVGEMRDLETARTAVQAALTGHLVLSTLHTNDAPSAITRLLDMGLEDYLVSSTLLGVVAQRLVRRRCGSCKNEQPAREICNACHGCGYAGRLAVSEVLEIDEPVKNKLRAGITAYEVRRAALEAGFKPMSVDGKAKLDAGLTDKSEILRVLGAESDAI